MNTLLDTQTLPELWNSTFQNLPKKIIPNEKRLNEQIEKFGFAFGKVKAQIIKHKLSGMHNAAEDLKKKLDTLEGQFDDSVHDYLGYPKLDPEIKKRLEEKAHKMNKFFNDYVYTSYPRPIPEIVLKGIEEAKKYFSQLSIKIWAIENEPLLKDPVVVACIGTINEPKYYLIGIWDNDIQLSELIDVSSFEVKK